MTPKDHPYIQAFVEVKVQEIWVRKFPKHKQQVQWGRPTHLYLRGMGGGYSVKLVTLDDAWATYQRIHYPFSLIRISRQDYERLKAKAGAA